MSVVDDMTNVRRRRLGERVKGVRAHVLCGPVAIWGLRRALGPRAAIWGLSIGMVLTAAVLFGSAGTPAVMSSVSLPLWGLVLGFAAAERFVVHVHFRSSAHSMSLGELPLVFGLLFTPGHEVIVAAALGRVLVLALHRRLPPMRLAFNLAAFLLWGCVAVLVFHALTGPAGAVEPRVWAAAVAAAGTASIVTALLVSAAVSLSEATVSLGRIASTLGSDLAVAVANTCIALGAARLLSSDWEAGLLMAVPVAALFLTFRAYTSERQRHARLEFLYEAARTLSHAPEVGPALEGVLVQALHAFRADVAELILFSPAGDTALRTSVQLHGARGALEAVEPEVAAEMRALIERRERGACALPVAAGDGLGDYLRSRGLGEGLFAVLRGERSWIGAMMTGSPSGVVDSFSPDDLKLFETLANNTSVALENDRLGQAVWQLTELQRELEHQATHDPLTDLANRALFVDQVGEALRGGAGHGLALRTAAGSASVIFIDIDDFKTVNDSLGHAAGDELLVAISRRLQKAVGPGDVVARLGGDEFAVLLEGGSSESRAVNVADAIIRRLADRFWIADQYISVRASAGIATGAHPAVGPEELIRNADVAMYRVKSAGKCGYQLFEPGMEVSVLQRHDLKQRLRQAVKEDAFVLHYQPIADVHTGEPVALEALVRWLDGPRGPVPPSAFIPVAEEMGVIVAIGRSVLRRACQDAVRWGHGGQGPAVHVNLSLVELRDPDFLAGVVAALQDSGLAPERLVLEITESVVLSEPEKSIATLMQLRELGVRLALDDFGTGYSSLSHLRSLPIDCLKIGKPFVDGLTRDRTDRAFMAMIVELAAQLGLDVVAEGIETPKQLEALRELGCRFGQGFYLGRPAELRGTQVAGARRSAGRVHA